MALLETARKKFKEFGPTSWSINNRTSIYLMIIFISIIGVYQFATLPKERFPDIVIPTIYVQTIYVGNSPKDIENLVTRPIEKQLKGITGAKIKKITSTSVQDYSAIIVEFETDVKTDVATQKVKASYTPCVSTFLTLLFEIDHLLKGVTVIYNELDAHFEALLDQPWIDKNYKDRGRDDQN